MKRPLTLFALVFVLSSLVHFVGLSHPREVVFDEVHFGGFVTDYGWTGKRFFDIHPPHSKLIIAGLAKLGGYKGTMDFSLIGNPYGENPVVAFRLMAAIAGTLLPLVFMLLLYLLGGSWAIALLGGLAVTLDNALTIQSRLIALDSLLLLSIFGAITCAVAADRFKGFWSACLFLGCGTLIGLAVGTKYTGIVVVGLVGLVILGQSIDFKKLGFAWLKFFSRTGMVFFSAAFVFVLGWVIHFALLSEPSRGDSFYKLTGNFWTDFFNLQKVMISVNQGLDRTHPYASPWWGWPLMKNVIFYWSNKTNAGLYLIGNPVVWLGSLWLFLEMVFDKTLGRWQKRKEKTINEQSKKKTGLWLPVVGYFAAYLPLVSVHRILFLYHYFTPLLFSLAAGLLWLDGTGWTKEGSLKEQPRTYFLVVGALVLGFVVLVPVTYGLGWLAEYQQIFTRLNLTP